MDARREITLMGIVNLTPDSFYAGSRVRDVAATVEGMLRDGASIIDFGAVSTRPGAVGVTEKEEWARLEPALRAVREDFPGLRFSVDTTRSGIVRRTFEYAGPFIVNDISAGEEDTRMLSTVAACGLGYVAMHKRGTPETMQSLTDYPEGVTEAVCRYFEDFATRAEAAGVRDWILDPGFGFAKTVDQNYALLSDLWRLRRFDRPVLVGVSRKSMIYKPLGITPEDSLAATQVVQFKALEAGADILRVHDVAAARQTVQLYRTFYG